MLSPSPKLEINEFPHHKCLSQADGGQHADSEKETGTDLAVSPPCSKKKGKQNSTSYSFFLYIKKGLFTLFPPVQQSCSFWTTH